MSSKPKKIFVQGKIFGDFKQGSIMSILSENF